MRIYAFGTLVFLFSAPALAADGAQVPEPSNLALFGLGAAGLVIGRQVAKRNSRRDKSKRDKD